MDDFDRLRAVVDDDERLQTELFAYTEWPPFVAALGRIAERHGLIVSEERIWHALEDGRAAWHATWT